MTLAVRFASTLKHYSCDLWFTGVSLSLMSDPLQIELPVRASEAAALSEIVFQVTEGRRLSDDLRNRIAGRVETLGLETILPHMGSLQADPIHPNCFFVAVDAVRGGLAKPYLLRLANANAPSSGLFQKSILIGRMRPGGGREIVINAVPFGPQNQEAVRTFVSEVDRLFLPRPAGTAFTVASPDPDAFTAFRGIQQDAGLNVASFAGDWYEGVLHAIRAGWREGYAISATPIVLSENVDPIAAVLERVGYTKLVLDVSQLPAGAAGLARLAMAYDAAVRVNGSQPSTTWKRPDLEVCWDSASEPTDAAEITALLQDLRESGRAAQSVGPKLAAGAWHQAVEAIRSANAALRVPSSQADLREIGRACGGRVHCVAAPGQDLRGLVKLLRS